MPLQRCTFGFRIIGFTQEGSTTVQKRDVSIRKRLLKSARSRRRFMGFKRYLLLRNEIMKDFMKLPNELQPNFSECKPQNRRDQGRFLQAKLETARERLATGGDPELLRTVESLLLRLPPVIRDCPSSIRDRAF